MIRRRLVLIGATVIAAACVEDLTTPGVCPSYCPKNQLTIVDTVLANNISRDSAFRGYVLPNATTEPFLLAANLPGIIDGRVILRMNGRGARYSISTTDTSTGAIIGADSARLSFTVVRRDTAIHNLTLRLYRLPKTIDSTTTFADLSGPFTDSLVRTVNLDTLIAQPGHKDSVTGDIATPDTASHTVALSLKLDTAAARYIGADSGTVAYGVRVSADAPPSIAISRGSVGLQWWVRVDSLGTSVARTLAAVGPAFSSFVFDPPAPAIDSTLTVGGVPSTRSILRVAVPRVIRDSTQIIRGTLILVPAMPARGAPIDSFAVEAHTVLVDLGAKSPIALDVTRTDTTMIRIGSTDTVRIEVTNLLQFWASDSTQPTTIVLTAKDEAQSFAEVRFYPSLATPFRPSIEITFVRRYPFGGR